MCIVGSYMKIPVTKMMHITYNTPYVQVALIRLCKLQMKHLPLLGIDSLIVQEFK